MTAQSTSTLPHHDESEAVVAAPPETVFALLDDHRRLSAHMGQSSWQMGGGRMETILDEGQGKVVGSHIRMSGNVLGLTLSLDEVVTEREPPTRKVWETVGTPRLLVIGQYRMGFSIAPMTEGSRVRVFIDYALPASWFGQLLGRVFGRFYAHWCTRTMVEDVVRHLAKADTPFPSESEGLPAASPSASADLADGDEFDLRVTPVAKRLGDATVRMLAYNGSIPGPTLRVRQGSELRVNVVNEGDVDATVHWHGLRLENRYDGTAETQQPIPHGGSFTYRIRFPDPGVYWYHPHIREDYAQEMGLYGNILVVPSDPDYWPPVHREITLTLDDILLEHGKIAPFRRSETTHTAMGRFGNVLLVNGELEQSLAVRCGEVVRLYLTNTANTRVFNLGLTGGRMKLVGGDSGHVEREELVQGIIIAPSERVVVDVLFDTPGRFELQHRSSKQTYPLAAITVSEERAEPLMSRFESLRTLPDMVTERERARGYLDAEPDKTLALVAEMDMGEPKIAAGATIAYVCAMHPEVVRDAPGRCPKCWMKLMAREVPAGGYACPMHPDVRSERPDRCPKCGMKLVPSQSVTPPSDQAPAHSGHKHAGESIHGEQGGSGAGHDSGAGNPVPPGIEWEDDMVELNRQTTPANMRWKIIDRATGAAGHAINWRFRVGDRVKIRVVNTMDSDHPMHHPFHIHGAGRFLILSRDGVVEPNLVWKDTVLIPTGQTVDLLLDVTNPGRWMAHCHIAEHHESGMMFSFDVEP